MTPSRDFMVRQAVLNAAAKRMPATVKYEGVASALRCMTYEEMGWVPTIAFAAVIHAEFHKLAQRYEAAA